MEINCCVSDQSHKSNKWGIRHLKSISGGKASSDIISPQPTITNIQICEANDESAATVVFQLLSFLRVSAFDSLELGGAKELEMKSIKLRKDEVSNELTVGSWTDEGHYKFSIAPICNWLESH